MHDDALPVALSEWTPELFDPPRNGVRRSGWMLYKRATPRRSLSPLASQNRASQNRELEVVARRASFEKREWESSNFIWSPVGTSRPRYRTDIVPRYIESGALDSKEKYATRIFLEKPADPTSENAILVAERLALAYSTTPAEVLGIWATKSFRPFHENGYKLNQWRTDALPDFFPDYNYPKVDPARYYPRPAPRPAVLVKVLDQLFTDNEFDEADLWGPASTTKHMLLEPPQLIADTPHMPGHKVHHRYGERVKTMLCDRGSGPPNGHVDLIVIECSNLPVPHEFRDFWNVSTISPMVQVEVVVTESNGKRRVDDCLKTGTMTRSKLEIYGRTPINAVFNETCRFSLLRLPNPLLARTELLVSVMV